jgi:hypothetical protein
MTLSNNFLDFNTAGPQRVERIIVPAPTPAPEPEPQPRTFDVDPDSRMGAAIWYAEVMRWPVFPILDKKPATRHGQNDATRDPERLRGWFTPGWEGHEKDIAVATGARSGVVVIDIDVKGKSGWDSLEELGMATCPETPLAHTPSGGAHLFFRHPGPEWFVKSLCPWVDGVDLKADRSSCSLPPATGRRWDPHLNLGAVPLADLPPWVPREPVQQPDRGAAARSKAKLDAYGGAALMNAVKAICEAGNGEQQETLNKASYGIGRLIGGGEIDGQEARRRLLWAAERMSEYGNRWSMSDRAHIVDRALAEGEKNPRQRPRR